MPPIRFKDLTEAAGVPYAYGQDASQEETSSLSGRARDYVKKYPHLADLRVIPSNRDAYDYVNNVMLVRTRDPDVLSHEMEHAESLTSSGSFYKKLLSASQAVVRANNTVALPAILTLAGMVEDKEKRSAIYKVLLGISTAAAVPNLYEEAKASAKAMYTSPDKMRTMATLGPAFASHALHDLTAPGLYLSALRLNESVSADKKKVRK